MVLCAQEMGRVEADELVRRALERHAECSAEVLRAMEDASGSVRG
jgi:hypothetical protein